MSRVAASALYPGLSHAPTGSMPHVRLRSWSGLPCPSPPQTFKIFAFLCLVTLQIYAASCLTSRVDVVPCQPGPKPHRPRIGHFFCKWNYFSYRPYVPYLSFPLAEVVEGRSMVNTKRGHIPGMQRSPSKRGQEKT
jgi:hypothetical protein